MTLEDIHTSVLVSINQVGSSSLSGQPCKMQMNIWPWDMSTGLFVWSSVIGQFHYAMAGM